MPVSIVRAVRGEPPYLASLDGLRALAVALVVMTHAAFLTGHVVTGGMAGRIWGRGDFGVAIFFSLSGFLLYRSLVAQDARGGMRLRAYWWRRAARILPAYWLALAAVALVVQPSPRSVLLHATATQVYVADLGIPGFTQSWSIATELAFYAVLPLLVLGLRPLRRRDPSSPMRALIVMGLAGLALTWIIGGGEIGREPLYERWLPARLPNFVLGMILAEALAQPGHALSAWIRSVAASPWSAICLAGSAYLLATTPVAGALTLGGVGGDLDLAVKMLLSCIVAFGLMVPLLWGPDNAYRSLLTHPASRYLGRISYGIFLWHLAVFEGLYALSGLAVFAGGMLPLLTIGVPLTLALAALSYHYLEQPTSRWVSRRLHRSQEARGSASSARSPETRDPTTARGPRQGPR